MKALDELYVLEGFDGYTTMCEATETGFLIESRRVHLKTPIMVSHWRLHTAANPQITLPHKNWAEYRLVERYVWGSSSWR